jgi:PadR family transcriptional regulator, regulatory protein PadR
MNEDSTSSEMKKGLLVLAVLQVISHKKVYAAEILHALNETEFSTQEGTLYPLLSRLKREGLIDHEWVESPSGPPRKYYKLSKPGHLRSIELMEYVTKLRTQLKSLKGGKHE